MLWNAKWFPGTNLQDINLDWILKKVSALRGGSTGQYLYKKSNKDFDFGWKTGGGGSGTSDYLDLDNKPSINNVELIGNKTAADFGLALLTDIPVVPVQSVNDKTGAVVLSASDVGAYVKPENGIPQADLSSDVQTRLNKADTALQAVPPTYRTAVEQDTIDESILGNIATIESSPTTASHTIGDYIVYNGQLYTAVSTIAVGASLVPGTNIQAISASDLAQKFYPLVSGLTVTLHHTAPVLIYTDRGGLWSTGQAVSRGFVTLSEYTGAAITLVDNTNLTITNNISAGMVISVISSGYFYFT